MSAQSPKAIFLSASLHVAIALLIVFLTWRANRQIPAPPIFELVRGEGDNYLAREAPAQGTPDGIKVDMPLPKPPAPETRQSAPPPAPVELAPAPPVVPPIAPAPRTPEKSPPKTISSFAKDLQRKLSRAESKAKQQVAKERAAEEKKRLAEEKRLAEAQKKLTKAEFDAQNKMKSSTPPKSAPPKIPKIDAAGIAKGVAGGSKDNKIGGANGKALTADYTDALAAYFSLFKQRLRERFQPPPGLSDTLKARIEFHHHADGTISNARIIASSGSSEFDRAVLDAVRRVILPERPDRASEMVSFTFTMREEDEG